MSNVAIVNEMDASQLMAMMGGAQNQQQGGQENNLLPILRINYQEEDDNGNELKKGTFTLQGGDNNIYAKEATFRALGDYMQYLHYSQEEESVVNRTIIHRIGDEPIDEKGGVRCGRPIGKELQQMTPDQKAPFKEITCFRYIYGIVSMSGVTAEGEKTAVTDVPCLFRMKGTSFMNFSREVVEPSNQKNLQFQQVPNKLTTQRHKNGSVIYFTAHFSPDFANTVEIGQADMEVMRKILTMIKDNNDQVKAKYDEALRSKQSDANDEKLVGAIDSEYTEVDDLDF
jgi:hypothetical protein